MNRPQAQESGDGLRELTGYFTELAQALSRNPDAQLDPARVVRFIAAAIPHSDHCGLTLVRPDRRPQTVAATGDLPRRVDELQYDLDEGPCLDAADDHDIVLVQDLFTDTRWPTFAGKCVDETGVRSMLSIRLSLGLGNRAAMNLYGTTVGLFSDLDIGVASMFGPFAALAVQSRLHQQDVENLHAALTSSRQIGTAIGILMAREFVTSERAFELLREASQHLNRKLRDIAAEVEVTGELPGGESDPQDQTQSG